jgi:AGZA family xanthine/uracil permease-like MFS transporter
MVGSYPPITAPALVLVGAMMLRSVTRIAWDDYTECVPAFLVMVGIPFGYSIGDGPALGFIAYPAVKLLAGRAGEVKWPVWLVSALMLGYFVFERGKVE